MGKSIFLLAAPALVISTAAIAGDFDKAKFAALTPGMTKADVVAAVGEPSQKMSADIVYLYQYWGPPDDAGKKKTVIVTIFFDKDDKLDHVAYYSN